MEQGDCFLGLDQKMHHDIKSSLSFKRYGSVLAEELLKKENPGNTSFSVNHNSRVSRVFIRMPEMYVTEDSTTLHGEQFASRHYKAFGSWKGKKEHHGFLVLVVSVIRLCW